MTGAIRSLAVAAAVLMAVPAVAQDSALGDAPFQYLFRRNDLGGSVFLQRDPGQTGPVREVREWTVLDRPIEELSIGGRPAPFDVSAVRIRVDCTARTLQHLDADLYLQHRFVGVRQQQGEPRVQEPGTVGLVFTLLACSDKAPSPGSLFPDSAAMRDKARTVAAGAATNNPAS